MRRCLPRPTCRELLRPSASVALHRHSNALITPQKTNLDVVLPSHCRELLRPSASVALHRHSNALVDILPPEADSTISVMSQTERPDVTYQVRWRAFIDR